MDLPLLVSPDKLGQLRYELSSTAAQLGRIADLVERLGAQDDAACGWAGNAQHAFAAATQSAGAHCREISRRLAADAARVARLEEQLAAELAALHRLEHEVLGALHRLALWAVDDITGDARTLLDRLRQRLPRHGSPGWRDVAAALAPGGWL